MGSEPSEAETLEQPVSVQASPSSMRKQMPQKSVDQFWEKFTTKYPGKVHSILPANIYAKTKASKETKGVAKGHIAITSYEQAASECKHAVEKIAKECRRVNHKYRDPHFDIEFDLKGNQRDCLDGFGYTQEVDRRYPRSVKRVTEIFDKPVFFEEGATASDVRQGNSGDCWFLSALCALCNKKDLINKVCVARDEIVGVYGFVFHRDGEWIQTLIDDKLFLIASDWWESSDEEKRTFAAVNRLEAEEKYRLATQSGSKALFFAQCTSENETWLPLLEKAFAKAHGDYSAIDGGFTGEAIEDLTGGVTTELFTTDILDKDKFWSEEIMKVNEKFLFSCATGTFDSWQGSDVAARYEARNNIVPMHAYSIMEAREIKGMRLLKVRNPWGEGEWRGPWSDGSEQWDGEWMKLLDHKFGDDGMFWISYEDLLRRYSGFDRTRLFGADWQLSQQWTTVDVPWTADYNSTKFTMTLTKRSPVVIALSQLDDRYYKGLQGQYTFQLHFRLHKDGEDDYIVRSHGNYCMSRSVSTDLELDAGTYSVLMKITATRWPTDSTPEDIIRDNCKNRQAKLIQIGLAYDLAHARGIIRETEAEKEKKEEKAIKKKQTEKKKKLDAKREEKLKEWQYNKKLKAREKRRVRKREDYERKMAEARKAAGKDESSVVKETAPAAISNVNAANAGAGLEAEIEKQAAAGAKETQVGEPAPDVASLPSPPAETRLEEAKATNGALPVVPEESAATKKEEDSGATDAAMTTSEDKTGGAKSNDVPSTEAAAEAPDKSNTDGQKSQPSESALPSVPTVTINGELAPADAAIGNAGPADAAPPPSVGALSSLAPDDDYQYDSDASFDSSIDSVLDFFDSAPEYARQPPGSAVVEEELSPSEPVEGDEEFENDPWNAVCVVGLRVYSKDEGCKVGVRRPKQDGDEDTPLDLDDASKGASGEKEGDDKNKDEVKVDEGVVGKGTGAVKGG